MMETISIKLEKGFARSVEKFMKDHNYHTKTEFVRAAIRDKIKDLEKEEALERARKLFSSSRLKTTDKQRHEAGEKAFEELERELQ